MNLLTKEQFLNKKKSDTLVIYGCGYSINRLSDEDLLLHSSFDSVGFNWLKELKLALLNLFI